MYFNINKDNTNKVNLKKLILPLIIIGIIILGVVVIIFINHNNKYGKNDNSIITNNNQTYSIQLIGEKEITIYKDSEYIEPGYTAFDNNNIDYTKEVKITNNLDTNNVGKYIITYTINGVSVERTINVIEKPLGATYLYLKGDSTIYLNEKETYEEPGYIVIDTVDSNLSNQVKITNNINYSNPGTYKIIYTVTNSSGVTTTATRTVVVLGSKITVTISNEQYTNQSVDINIKVEDNYFNYLLLPDGKKVTQSSYTYQVENNGTYKFIAFSKKGSPKEKSIEINNIDKEKPTGNCTLTIDNDKSYINISATDNLSVEKYIYNQKEYLEDTINVTNDTQSANITIYDVVGNTNKIECNVNKIKKEYTQYILIGDSRFVGMDIYVRQPSNVHIIAKESMGYNWFVNTAISKVNEILKKYPNELFYIYSNLGVNDYNNSYATKLNSLANNEWKNHKVIYISVNPYAGYNYSNKNKQIINFNNNQKLKLNNVYYCDTYNGIGQSNFGCASSSDCVHYNSTTYKKIYNYIINNCSF